MIFGVNKAEYSRSRNRDIRGQEIVIFGVKKSCYSGSRNRESWSRDIAIIGVKNRPLKK